METDSFEADLRQALAHHAAEVPADAIERLRRRRYRPDTRGRAGMAIAGLTGVAAVAAAVGLLIAQPASPSSVGRQAGAVDPAPQAQLAAWSVTSQDGVVTVVLRQPIQVAALQAKLRAIGVPARVDGVGTATPGCVTYPASFAQAQTALGINGVGKAETIGKVKVYTGITKLVFRQSTLPSQAGVQIAWLGGDHLLVRLVKVSAQCTGS